MTPAADRPASSPSLALVASLLRRWQAPAAEPVCSEEWGVEVPYLSFTQGPAENSADWPLAA